MVSPPSTLRSMMAGVDRLGRGECAELVAVGVVVVVVVCLL